MAEIGLSERLATRRLPQLLRAALRHCRDWLNLAMQLRMWA